MNDDKRVEEIEADLAEKRAAYAAWVAEGCPHVTPESDEDGLQESWEGARSVEDLLAELDEDESRRSDPEHGPQKLGETGAADTVQADAGPTCRTPGGTK